MMTRKTALVLGALAFLTLAVAHNAQAGQCRDPWVTQAIQEVTGRAPTGNHESGDCNIQNFNRGRWNSYPELVGYVRKYSGGNNALVARPSLANAGNRVPLAGSPSFNNANSIVAAGGGNFNKANKLIGDGGGT